MTLEEIKEKYGANGYVYCSVCPLGVKVGDYFECSTDESCDGQEKAYKNIKRYLDNNTVVLYVDWKRKILSVSKNTIKRLIFQQRNFING